MLLFNFRLNHSHQFALLKNGNSFCIGKDVNQFLSYPVLKFCGPIKPKWLNLVEHLRNVSISLFALFFSELLPGFHGTISSWMRKTNFGINFAQSNTGNSLKLSFDEFCNLVFAHVYLLGKSLCWVFHLL